MKDDKKSSKMKMSELKAKIKEMALSEMNLDINDETFQNLLKKDVESDGKYKMTK